MASLSVNLEGQTVPLSECFWLWVEPSGCVLGSTLADLSPTADQAHAEFVLFKRERETQLRWGFEMLLIHKSRFETLAHACLSRQCDHVYETPLCRRCGRFGRQGMRSLVRDGKPITVCAMEKTCRRRAEHRYGRRGVNW